jgi:hypothetical protein
MLTLWQWQTHLAWENPSFVDEIPQQSLLSLLKLYWDFPLPGSTKSAGLPTLI